MSSHFDSVINLLINLVGFETANKIIGTNNIKNNSRITPTINPQTLFSFSFDSGTTSKTSGLSSLIEDYENQEKEKKEHPPQNISNHEPEEKFIVEHASQKGKQIAARKSNKIFYSKESHIVFDTQSKKTTNEIDKHDADSLSFSTMKPDRISFKESDTSTFSDFGPNVIHYNNNNNNNIISGKKIDYVSKSDSITNKDGFYSKDDSNKKLISASINFTSTSNPIAATEGQGNNDKRKSINYKTDFPEAKSNFSNNFASFQKSFEKISRKNTDVVINIRQIDVRGVFNPDNGYLKNVKTKKANEDNSTFPNSNSSYSSSSLKKYLNDRSKGRYY